MRPKRLSFESRSSTENCGRQCSVFHRTRSFVQFGSHRLDDLDCDFVENLLLCSIHFVCPHVTKNICHDISKSLSKVLEVLRLGTVARVTSSQVGQILVQQINVRPQEHKSAFDHVHNALPVDEESHSLHSIRFDVSFDRKPKIFWTSGSSSKSRRSVSMPSFLPSGWLVPSSSRRD
jgi:hypothetical protein